MTSLSFDERSIQVGVRLTPQALFTAAGLFAAAGVVVWLVSQR
ncbi:MAG TPA: hypothetical protein VGG39_08935 [Polyangiaceae bacterium]|jgi:hypothetical protein